jgi:hypothetical protein
MRSRRVPGKILLFRPWLATVAAKFLLLRIKQLYYPEKLREKRKETGNAVERRTA